MKKAIVLGGGFAGCTISHLLKEDGWDCTIVDKEKYLGGGVRTFFYGGHPYTEGPRVYYGYSEKVYKWINLFLKMKASPLYLKSYVEQDKRFYSYPIHEDDIKEMPDRDKIFRELEMRNNSEPPKNFEEYWRNAVGPTLYDKYVNHYSKKMWMLESNTQIDTFSWSAKDNPINSGSKESYKGSIMAYPTEYDGYNQYFEKTAAGSRLVLGKTVKEVDFGTKTVILDDGSKLSGDIIVSSIPIEELCGYRLGELPYAGRDFIVFVLPCKQVFPDDLRFCHYTGKEPYTRIVEYKKLTGYEADDTLMVMEIPAMGKKLYPYMLKEYIERARQYKESLPEGIFSIGRLGTYRYSTIEQTIAQAFGAYTNITGKTWKSLGLEQEFHHIGDVKLLKSRKNEGEVVR